jgi:hypothetical protein
VNDQLLRAIHSTIMTKHGDELREALEPNRMMELAARFRKPATR